MPWSVYLVRCADGSLYTGVATDVARRVADHNGGRGAKYTRARLPVTLVHHEPAADRSAALRREARLKRLPRAAKERLVQEGTHPMPDFRGFPAASLTFLRGLKRHNARPWFEARREVYEAAVRDPMRALIEAVDLKLGHRAPEIIGDPRKSMFRIHRDVRFSKDKSPYKTWASAWFYHRDAGKGVGQDAHGGAGLYFHLEPGGCEVAGGLWMPEKNALGKVRDAIVADPEGWERVVTAPAFRRMYKALSTQAVLTRTPRGYPADHPAERWLRYKSFTSTVTLTDAQVRSPRLPELIIRRYEPLIPLVRWLNGALGYPPISRRY
ncbi:MAG TPA: TIGR02453 family protein [Gemmatimonadales bacterium]|nr:TIGR02453 family protein [Gemmatimonadales bacterium]